VLCASVSCIGVVKLFGPVQWRSLLLQAGSRLLKMKRHLETEHNNVTACNCFLHLRTSRHATWQACMQKYAPCSKSRPPLFAPKHILMLTNHTPLNTVIW